MKRIKSFSEHVNESMINENLVSWVKSKLSKLSGWMKGFYEKIEKGEFKRIPKGPNKGKPVVMAFAAENGSFEDQFNSYRSQSGSQGNLKEAVIPPVYSREDQNL